MTLPGKLTMLNSEIHLTLINLIDEASEETLLTEQATLDEHKNLVASLIVRIMTLADCLWTLLNNYNQ